MVNRLRIVSFTISIIIIACLLVVQIGSGQLAFAHGKYHKTIAVEQFRIRTGDPVIRQTEPQTLKVKETAHGKSKVLTEQFEAEGPASIEISKQVTWYEKAKYQKYWVYYD